MDKNTTPKPCLLDIVRINSRWAQVMPDLSRIRYLDDGLMESIDFRECELVRQYSAPDVEGVITSGEGEFSDHEIENIHWGSEQVRYPYLKMRVTVFGEYRKP